MASAQELSSTHGCGSRWFKRVLSKRFRIVCTIIVQHMLSKSEARKKVNKYITFVSVSHTPIFKI